MSTTGVIWMDGQLGLQLAPDLSLQGVDYSVCVEDPDRHYSKHGFAYPLNAPAFNYAAAMENKMIRVPRHLSQSSHNTQWFVVTRKGQTLIVDIWDNGGTWEFAQYDMPMTARTRMVIGYRDTDRAMLTGIIKATTDHRKIQEIVTRRGVGNSRELFWTTVPEIVNRIETLYPEEEQHAGSEQKRTPGTPTTAR